MLGLESYDSDSDEERSQHSQSVPSSSSTDPKSSSSRPPATPGGLQLPTPKSTANLPATKNKKKKILVELPKLSKDDSDDEHPPAKRPRTDDSQQRPRSSALLSMLPAPKRTSIDSAAPQRVLGGGRPGIVYSAAAASVEPAMTELASTRAADYEPQQAEPEVDDPSGPSTSLLPPSLLLKGKSKAKTSPSTPAQVAATSSSSPNFFSLSM